MFLEFPKFKKIWKCLVVIIWAFSPFLHKQEPNSKSNNAFACSGSSIETGKKLENCMPEFEI